MIERPGLTRFANELRELVDRVWSLERRFRDQPLVKFFTDLEDVIDRTAERTDPPPAPGDVWGLNDDSQWDIITPAGGGGGAERAYCIEASFDGDDWTVGQVRWDEAEMMVGPADGVDGAIVGVIGAAWDVSAQFTATDSAITSCGVTTNPAPGGARRWQGPDPEAPPSTPCFTSRAAYSGAGVDEISVSADLAFTTYDLVTDRLYVWSDQPCDVVITLHQVTAPVFRPCDDGPPIET